MIDTAGQRLQSEHGPGQRGLAAARLADQGNDFPGSQFQVDTVDRACTGRPPRRRGGYDDLGTPETCSSGEVIAFRHAACPSGRRSPAVSTAVVEHSSVASDAPGVERATGRHRRGFGRVAGQTRWRQPRRPDHRWSGTPRPAPWCTGAWRRGASPRRAPLHEPPGVHHRQTVGDRRQHRQVVGDEHHRQTHGRACRSASSCSTWAWTITSSAVVGSSAISSCGSQASAMAIMTRCFWPPESSCG